MILPGHLQSRCNTSPKRKRGAETGFRLETARSAKILSGRAMIHPWSPLRVSRG